MIQPIKEGLEYFPVDVAIDNDDKIQFIESEHGLIGYSIIFKLFCRIYRNGYYCKWTKNDQLVFSKKTQLGMKKLNEIVTDALSWNLFDVKMYEDYNILTSERIQHTYLFATSKRKSVKLKREYLLLDVNDYNKRKNVNIYSINDDIYRQRK